jgi:hypothetical protein
MHDINVDGTCTAYDDPETSLTYIVEFHEGLWWFDSKLRNSLCNSNQLRAYGLSVCSMTWLILIMNLVFMFQYLICQCPLLELDGVVFLKTCVPSIDEVQSCPGSNSCL